MSISARFSSNTYSEYLIFGVEYLDPHLLEERERS